MIILGVADGADASAALVVNGALVAAVSQERIDRTRHSRAFPSGAIDAVLDIAGVKAREVDRIAFGASISPSSFLQSRPRLRAQVHPRWKEAWRGAQAMIRASGLYMVEQDLSRKVLEPRFSELGFENARLELLEHDRAHATAAYRCQDRTEVLVLTVDTPGDGVAVTVSTGRHLQLDRLFLQTALASIATFPVRVADALGIEPSEIGALGARGVAPAALTEAFRTEVGVAGDGFSVRGMVAHPDPLVGRVSAHAPADVAAAAHEAIVAAVLAFAQRWVERTGFRHLVVAGTVFGDPHVTGRLARQPYVESLFVCPAPGDEGLAIGAALGSAGTVTRTLVGLAWGPRYTETHCYKALSVASLPRNKVSDPSGRIAELLAAGRTVARFDGGLEIGEAKANRAVLFRADDPALRDRARASLRLPAWSPVSAVIPDAVQPGQALPVSTMGLDFPSLHRGDGTWVAWQAQDEMATLLSAYRAASGLPVLGHLPLRLADEPVACSPGDAVRTWRTSDLDALMLGPYLVERSAVV